MQGATYIVICNGNVVKSSSWASGVPIVQDIDGLNLGTYNFTITVRDGLGNSATDEVNVSVTPMVLIILLVVVGVAAIVVVSIIIRMQSRRSKNLAKNV